MATKRIMAIHLWQPWADLICCGAKTIETRTWDIRHRGLVLICSTKVLNKEGRQAIETYQSDIWEHGPLLPTPYRPRLGVAMATANLVASRDMTPDDRRAAAYADHWGIEYWCEKSCEWKIKKAWCLEDVTPIEPFSLAGRQRPFFTMVEESLLEPALLFDLPARQAATSKPERRQLSFLI